MKKQVIAILATTLLLSAVTVATTPAQILDTASIRATERTAISGSCGDSITWHYNSSTGALTITGTGPMDDYDIHQFESWSGGPWYAVQEKIQSVTVSSGVTSIGSSAFYGCENMTSISLPDTVTSIGSGAFFSCKSLPSIHLPDSITSIGQICFAHCYELTSVTFPSNITSIEQYTLYYCTKLKTVTIPGTVTSIGQVAFDILDHVLTDIYFGGTEAMWAAINVGKLNAPLEEATIHFATVPEISTAPEIPGWAASYAQFAVETFMPDLTAYNYNDETNRGLIAQSIFNLAGDGGSYSSNFNDAGAHASAIGWCYNHSVMAGASATWFASEDKVTREQCALILRQLALSQGKDITANTSALSTFSDQGDISSWAAEGVAWAVEQGLMAGSNGKLSPQGYVTRIQVAVMLSAFDQL